MQRKFLQVAILAASVFGMTALSARAQVNIDFWDQVWGPAPYSQRAESLVEEFNKSQKDIHVTYRSVPWASWYETYVTAIASGSAPDLSTGAGFQAVQFYDMDAIYPVDELVDEMSKDGSAADFAPGSLDAVKYDGHYVALPWAMDVRVLSIARTCCRRSAPVCRRLGRSFVKLRRLLLAKGFTALSVLVIPMERTGLTPSSSTTVAAFSIAIGSLT